MKRIFLLATVGAVLVMAAGLTVLVTAQPHPREAERHEPGPLSEEQRHEMEQTAIELKIQHLHLEEMGLHLELLELMKQTTFDPESCALLAIGAITDDLDLEPERQIQELRQVLERARSLGVRNAIRMALKDLYMEADQPDKCLEVLRDMILENDEVVSYEDEGEEDEEGWEEEEEEGEPANEDEDDAM
ncbi:MAG: hypothetical protein ISS74_02985 [Planctomycetes bacterium]|nr:hypothetical protein [Planctomycetota bacterium]